MCIHDFGPYPFTDSYWSVPQGGMFPDLTSVYSTNYPDGLELVKKYNRYVVNRFAAFRNVFMWEYNNEWGAYTSEDWLNEIDEVIHQSDPYNRPHTVSFWNIEYSRYSDLYDSPTIDVTDDHSYAEVYQYTNYNEFEAANRKLVDQAYKAIDTPGASLQGIEDFLNRPQDKSGWYRSSVLIALKLIKDITTLMSK